MFDDNFELRLKDNFVAEPIVRGWHAWSHLISPVTAALNLANKQLKTLRSFVDSPEIHAKAASSPELRGGAFVDLPVNQVPFVKGLISEAEIKHSFMLDFAREIKALSKKCFSESSTGSLTPLYSDLHPILDGCVEFYYGDNGAPGFRIHESFLYNTELHSTSEQASHLYLAQEEARASAFSTPRPSGGMVLINKAFDSKFYDFIGRLRFEKMTYKEIQSELTSYNLNPDILNDFLCDDALTQDYPPAGSWRYFGHACVLITAEDGTNVLVDPIIASQSTTSAIDRYSYNALPEHIDFVVITHNHADHIVIESLLPLRHRIGTIVVPRNNGGICDPSMKLVLDSLGFENVVSLETMDTIEKNKVVIRALPFLGEHGDLDISAKAAWYINTNGKSFLFAADSNNINPGMYERIRESLGNVDMAFIGMECVGAPMSWVYGPLLMKPVDRKSDQSRRLDGSDAERGISLIERLGCKDVHVYALGREPWLSFIMSIDDSEDTEQMRQSKMFIKECHARGYKADILFGKSQGII